MTELCNCTPDEVKLLLLGRIKDIVEGYKGPMANDKYFTTEQFRAICSGLLVTCEPIVLLDLLVVGGNIIYVPAIEPGSSRHLSKYYLKEHAPKT